MCFELVTHQAHPSMEFVKASRKRQHSWDSTSNFSPAVLKILNNFLILAVLTLINFRSHKAVVLVCVFLENAAQVINKSFSIVI
jgi:hypothetical protein